MTIQRQATLYLLLVTISWGLTFPLISLSVKEIAPISFVFYRFVMAAVLMLPFILKELRQTTVRILLFSVLLGFLNFAAYSLQSIGLKTISSNESAFITSTCVVFVPILSLFFRFDKPTFIDYLCSFICLMGLYALTGANISQISIGELYTILCALSVALAIIVVQLATTKATKYNLLTFYQILFTCAFALPDGVHTELNTLLSFNVIIAITFCAIFATVMALYLQSRYQQYITPSKTALIFCMEPLFATLFGWFINSEQITSMTMLGGCLILLSVALPDLLKLFKFQYKQIS